MFIRYKLTHQRYLYPDLDVYTLFKFNNNSFYGETFNCTKMNFVVEAQWTQDKDIVAATKQY